jgi:plasmid maintenance system antidote protein VapI
MKFEDYASKVLKTTEESYVGSGLDLRFEVMEFIMRELSKNRMTQTKLAIKLKMKPSQLNRILKAESNLTVETIARIFHAFNCKPTIKERFDTADTVSTSNTYVNQTIISQPKNVYLVVTR